MSASPEAASRPSGDGARILVFAIGGQEFALPLDPIMEVIRYRRPTPVPGAGPGILGILPLRGRMVTVVDGRQRLGLPEQREGRSAQIVVLRDAGELLGLVVDAVARVTPMASGDREPLPAALRLDRPERFEGIVRRESGYVLLLDVGNVLKGDR